MRFVEKLRESRLLVLSSMVLVALVVLLSVAIINPAVSPLASVADFDNDGVPDSSDVFPYDPSEWADSDEDGVGDFSDAFPDDPYESADADVDGIGDVGDFEDSGNGGVTISLVDFEFLGYDSSCHRVKYAPDPCFEIRVDSDGDEEFESIFQSEVFFGSYNLEDFFSAQIDLDDASGTFRFSIVVYDVWDTDSNEITDYEILDYIPLDGLLAEDETVGLPCCSTWTYCGEGDTDAPDCVLEYSVTTVVLD